MKLLQISKRIVLFAAVNLLVFLTIGLLINLIGVRPYLGHSYPALMVFCFVWGMGGALISLALSRLMAKWMMGVRVISPETSDTDERELLRLVYELADHAQLPARPQVGIYQSPEVNAFATGPSRRRALVAVSSGLLGQMRHSEVEGVLAHEIAHVANGDMVTMTLLQGVINAFVLFLARVLAFAMSQTSNREDNRGGNWMGNYLLVRLFEFVLSLFGFIVVAWFSRQREFRADAGGARFAGRNKMIGALERLKSLQENPEGQLTDASSPAFQAFKISSRPSLLQLFSTHPPLDERIARLKSG